MWRTTADGGEGSLRICVVADDCQIRFRFTALPYSLACHAFIVDYDDIHRGSEGLPTRCRGDSSRSIGSAISAVHSSAPVHPAINDASAPNCTSRRSRTLVRPMPSG